MIERLQRHPFAAGLAPAQLAALAACARSARFAEGEVIFREGDPALEVFLIFDGRVVLEQHVPGRGELQLETLSEGDLLGLSWLLPGGRWLLDARAVTPAEAIVLDARCLEARMGEDAALGLAVSRHLIHQLYRRLEHVRLQRLDVYGERW